VKVGCVTVVAALTGSAAYAVPGTKIMVSVAISPSMSADIFLLFMTKPLCLI
jgi:hypothetical protein